MKADVNKFRVLHHGLLAQYEWEGQYRCTHLRQSTKAQLLPAAHTLLELVRRRWGHAASWVIGYICILNNAFVCALIFLGAGQAFAAATGMSVYASCMLIPISVVIYAAVGGLKGIPTPTHAHAHAQVCAAAFGNAAQMPSSHPCLHLQP